MTAGWMRQDEQLPRRLPLLPQQCPGLAMKQDLHCFPPTRIVHSHQMFLWRCSWHWRSADQTDTVAQVCCTVEAMEEQRAIALTMMATCWTQDCSREQPHTRM